MTSRLLLASLAAAALTVPMPASSAATETAIREITVRPAEPVVGASGSVRLVIDVVAKGVRGDNGVTIKVEPGEPPKPVLGSTPSPSPSPSPSVSPTPTPMPSPSDSTAAVPGTSDDLETESELPASPEPRPALRAPEWDETDFTAQRRGDGWETWRFLPEKGLTRFYPSGTWTIAATAKGFDGESVTEYATFQLRRETRLTSVEADKVPGEQAVRLSGTLSRVDPEGFTEYSPYGKQEVEILYRKEDGDQWEERGVATTTSTGKFGRMVKGTVRGQWRARFAGGEHYAPEASAVHEIGK